jgi:hypothetical protein
MAFHAGGVAAERGTSHATRPRARNTRPEGRVSLVARPLTRLRHPLPASGARGNKSRAAQDSMVLLPAHGEKVPQADEGLLPRARIPHEHRGFLEASSRGTWAGGRRGVASSTRRPPPSPSPSSGNPHFRTNVIRPIAITMRRGCPYSPFPPAASSAQHPGVNLSRVDGEGPVASGERSASTKRTLPTKWERQRQQRVKSETS